jgi:GDPmannose 4,6-dehydratase
MSKRKTAFITGITGQDGSYLAGLLLSSPTGVEVLIADAKKVKRSLNWTPKITFKDLVKIMLEADLLASGLEAPGEGDAILAKKGKKKWWKGE